MECADSCPRGFHRERDARAMTGAQAYGAWVPAAGEILTELAPQYPATVTQAEFAAALQDRTGISAGQVPLGEWLGKVMADVGKHDGGEQLLRLIQLPPGAVAASKKTGRAKTAKATTVSATTDGQPTQSPKATRKPAKPRVEEVEIAVCPIHFLQLPASGQCAECD